MMEKEIIALVKRLTDLEHYVDDAEETDWDHIENELEYIEENYVLLDYDFIEEYTPESFEKRILELKRYLGLYVQEDMLDMMLPDRYDPNSDNYDFD
ncbi:hypothetical protein BMS3Abin15_00580 [bacterium BMS3Abin15]|nr:hypothetical protein BMS3Abin15_00580 [bacterium BMS3Abin15]